MDSDEGPNGHPNNKPDAGPSPTEVVSIESWMSDQNTEEKASNSPFKLPHYILKNLTPVDKYSPNRKHKQKSAVRRLSTDSRIEKLAKRSKVVQKRLEDVRQARERLLQEKVRKLHNNISAASIRRLNYLERIRQNARNFLRSTAGSYNLGDSLCNSFSVGQLRGNSSTKKSRSTSSIGHARGLKINTISIDKNNNILKSVLDRLHGASFPESIRLVRQNETPFIQFLHSLGIKDNGMCLCKAYRRLLYSFILVNDFQSAFANEISHPGFNSNAESSDPKSIFFSNFIWLALYKISRQLISDFTELVKISDLKNLDRTAFFESWRAYNFLFKIFKQNHHSNLIKILDKSIDISTYHVRLFPEDSSLREQNQYLVKTKLWFSKYDINEDWDWEATEFCENLKQSIKVLDLESAEKPYNLQLSILNETRTIVYDNVMFRLPVLYNFSSLEWRQHLFQDHFKNRMGPSSVKLKAGRNIMESISKSKSVCNPLPFGQESVHSLVPITVESFDRVHFVQTKYLFEKLYHDAFHYIWTFYDFDLSPNLSNVESLKLETHDKFGLEYIVVYYTKLSSLLAIGNSELSRFSYKFTEIMQILDFAAIQKLTDLTIHFEQVLYGKWYTRCYIADLQSYRRFDNIYLMINSPMFSKLKFNVSTNSPMLLFPKFCDWLKSFTAVRFSLSNYNHMLRASYERPKIMFEHRDESSFDFYKTTFIKLIMCGKSSDFQVNELNELYIYRLEAWSLRFKNLVYCNSAMLTTLNFYSSKHPSLVPHMSVAALKKELLKSISSEINGKYDQKPRASNGPDLRQIITKSFDSRATNLHLDEFESYFETSRRIMKNILHAKLERLWLTTGSEDYTSLLHGNFKYFHETLDDMIRNALADITYIYDIYHPLLNWVFVDLGKPKQH